MKDATAPLTKIYQTVTGRTGGNSNLVKQQVAPIIKV